MRFLIDKNMKAATAVAVALIMLGIAGCGVQVVDTGHRGVETKFGKIVGESLPEGLYFYNPITTKITEMDVRERKIDTTTMAYTKDVQNVEIAFVLNFHPDPSRMHVLYEKIGIDWSEKVVPQVVLSKIKEIVGRYEAVKLVSDRQAANREMSASIVEEFADKSITVKNFEITNLNFNDPFEKAVEAKVVAIQAAEESKNRTVKIREEADQKIISAKAEAESMRIRSQALSQNRSLVEYEAVQKWDGKLPEIMTSGATLPFINFKRD